MQQNFQQDLGVLFKDVTTKGAFLVRFAKRVNGHFKVCAFQLNRTQMKSLFKGFEKGPDTFARALRLGVPQLAQNRHARIAFAEIHSLKKVVHEFLSCVYLDFSVYDDFGDTLKVIFAEIVVGRRVVLGFDENLVLQNGRPQNHAKFVKLVLDGPCIQGLQDRLMEHNEKVRHRKMCAL